MIRKCKVVKPKTLTLCFSAVLVSSAVTLVLTFYFDLSRHRVKRQAIVRYVCDCSQPFHYTSPCKYTQVNENRRKVLAERRAQSRKLTVLNCTVLPECLEVPEEFKPIMSSKQIQIFLKLISTVVTALDKVKIDYFISGGTLLGARRHRGFIPWDDDFDMFVNIKNKQKVKSVLAAVDPKYSYASWSEANGKFYYSDLPSISEQFSHSWPFVDIFYYNEDATSIFCTEEKSRRYRYTKSNVFPIKRMPFCNLNLKVPRKVDYFLMRRYRNYNLSTCETRYWDHMKENRAGKITKILCKRLEPYFPFLYLD